VDALGARRVGLVSLAWIAACNGLLLLTPSPALAIGVRAVAGLGTGASFVAGSDYARLTGSPLTQGLFGAGSMAGGGLAVAVVPQFSGWRTPYWTALVLALAAVPLLAIGPRDHGREPRVVTARVLSDGRLYRLGAIHAAGFGLSVIAGNWVVTLLTRTSGYSDAKAGAVGALTLVAGVVTRPLGGVVLRERPDAARAIVVASLVAGAAGMAVLACFSSLPVAVAVAASLVVGLAAGLPFAPVFTGAQRLRPDAPGAAIGLVNAVAIVVIVVGTPLAGLAFSLPGDGRIAFAVLAALWLGALALVPSKEELGAAPNPAK
jgi:predicted MFS family arabinose efflux permease